MMTQQIIEIEAETLEEAREQLKAQIPEGFYVTSEKVISDGEQKRTMTSADTTEEAFARAQKGIPVNANILTKTEVFAPIQKVIMVEAFDEQSAISIANEEARKQTSNWAKIKAFRLVTRGSKGFFGIGKKPHQYEATVFHQSVVEIIYKPKAKISAHIRREEEKQNTDICSECGTLIPKDELVIVMKRHELSPEDHVMSTDKVCPDCLQKLQSNPYSRMWQVSPGTWVRELINL